MYVCIRTWRHADIVHTYIHTHTLSNHTQIYLPVMLLKIFHSLPSNCTLHSMWSVHTPLYPELLKKKKKFRNHGWWAFWPKLVVGHSLYIRGYLSMYIIYSKEMSCLDIIVGYDVYQLHVNFCFVFGVLFFFFFPLFVCVHTHTHAYTLKMVGILSMVGG